MAVDKRVEADLNLNEAKFVVEGDPLEIEKPESEVEVTEFIEDDQGNMQPFMDEENPEEDHNSNLALYLSDKELDKISIELMSSIEDDKTSREDWETQYTKGLDLLGFKHEERTRPFRGASAVTHPVLAEAAIQFQSQAYKELLPANGPVKTAIIGQATEELEQQAQRVQDYMNYQITYVMKDYETETDQMLFYLPLAGSAFRKVFYDSSEEKARSQFVPAEDLVVPYGASYLDDAERVTHIIKMNEIELKKKQIFGMYRDIDVRPYNEDDQIQDKYDSIEGVNSKGYTSDMYTLYECHCYLDLLGYEDADGQKLPYIVTVDESSNKILSIYRNYELGDALRKKKAYFVHYKFLPGLGFYGFGLIHMIGGLSRTATTALRQLLDAGTLSNLPAGFKQRGIRVRDEAQSIQPGEFRDVDAPGGNIRDAFMTLPFKEPSQTLLSLMGVVVQAGQRFAAIADMQVGDGNQQAAVGTTIALLERGSRVMSAIHKRLYVAMKNEFNLLANVFKTYLPAEYPYDVVGGERTVKVSDFDDKVDIIPIADPNIFSQAQRITMAQTELQLAQSNPQIHNLYEAYRAMYTAIGVKDIDKILPPPEDPMPMDPAQENILAMTGKPFQAFKGQDHQAHITAHLNFMSTNIARNNPIILSNLEKNIFEHISLMSQEQIEVEFRQEITQIQQTQQIMQQMAAQGPQVQQTPQFMQMQQQLLGMSLSMESRKAKLVAEMTQEFMEEENKIMGDLGNDPVVKLKQRELDLKAQDDRRKEEEGKEKINIDKMKAMMNQRQHDNKLAQNEELAELRADTSLTKQRMSQEAKIRSDMTKQRDTSILKGYIR